MKTNTIYTTLLLGFFIAAHLPAQDWVRLKSGERIRGEITAQEDGTISMINRVGEVLTVKESDCTKIKKGRGLSKKIERDLKQIDASNAKELFDFALNLHKNKSTRRHGERLLRRVLALDPTHQETRAALGHIHFQNTWYASEKDARPVISKFYKSKGYVSYKKSWAKPDDIDAMKEAPKGWLVHEGVWRREADVMKARGFISFRGTWLPPEEKDYVEHATYIQGKTGSAIEGKQVGSVIVFHHRGRRYATELATYINRSRQWFARTFAREESLKDLQFAIVFIERQEFDLFVEKCHDRYGTGYDGTPRERLPSSSNRGFMSISPLEKVRGRVQCELDMASTPPPFDIPGVPERKSSTPSGKFDAGLIITLDLAVDFVTAWQGSPNKAPSFLIGSTVANCRMYALGQEKTRTKTDSGFLSYGGKEGAMLIGSTMESIQVELREAMKSSEFPIESIFEVGRVHKDRPTAVYSSVFFEYLTKIYHENFVAYINDRETELSPIARFEKHFKGKLKAFQKKFESWVKTAADK